MCYFKPRSKSFEKCVSKTLVEPFRLPLYFAHLHPLVRNLNRPPSEFVLEADEKGRLSVLEFVAVSSNKKLLIYFQDNSVIETKRPPLSTWDET